MDRIHGTYCSGKLEFSGCMNMSGPQPIGGNGAPYWVADLFKRFPRIDTIALSGEKGSQIYARMAAPKRCGGTAGNA